jgi:hypothetical protein
MNYRFRRSQMSEQLKRHANTFISHHLGNPSMDEAVSLVNAQAELIKELQSPWISVEDRLPEEQGFYFSLDDCGRGNVDWFSGKDFENEYLTHWMPIPPTQGG